ncbi:hypothetical protein PCANC_15485 [Puccinia coronata f. sp. avenae]|uniref:Reverse transcriptase RNase H-like domain-containing protein n=1 Tax=Puccinia coronata f. sp. avenae TaxID=200324 RepID=A0A2N5VFA6_9BASI|nr:hypothetical protein PCANC_15485 [Puccinia coronata f. sp. avenae]
MVPKPDPTDVGWFDNTSASFGIGIIISSRWAHFKLKPLKNTGPTSSIAWLETAAARLGLLMLIQLGFHQFRRFTVWTEKTTTLKVICKPPSHDPLVNAKWATIQEILLTEQVDLHLARVDSANNIAKALYCQPTWCQEQSSSSYTWCKDMKRWFHAWVSR